MEASGGIDTHKRMEDAEAHIKKLRALGGIEDDGA